MYNVLVHDVALVTTDIAQLYVWYCNLSNEQNVKGHCDNI